MVRLFQERILLIGDDQRRLESAVLQAAPEAAVRSVATIFDGIAELSRQQFSTVMACAEPIERRPEAAVRTLRELSGQSRLLLFGDPTMEPLSQKMLDFGCDDYLITPATAQEVLKALSVPVRQAEAGSGENTTAPAERGEEVSVSSSAAAAPAAAEEHVGLAGVPLAKIMMDALNQHPGAAIEEAVGRINAHIKPEMELILSKEGTPQGAAVEGVVRVSRAIGNGMTLHLQLPREREAAGMEFVAELAGLFGTAWILQERHRRLQRLAFTDDLTGIFNCRYFKHFLSRTLVDAR
ncbi:MAG TPA: hypothetical protein VMD30_07055, partial [Tepidisphaeraceae bacterium]|nr:hypothetical protein [Tepidisphaeraceae bacterium]